MTVQASLLPDASLKFHKQIFGTVTYVNTNHNANATIFLRDLSRRTKLSCRRAYGIAGVCQDVHIPSYDLRTSGHFEEALPTSTPHAYSSASTCSHVGLCYRRSVPTKKPIDRMEYPAVLSTVEPWTAMPLPQLLSKLLMQCASRRLETWIVPMLAISR